MKLAPNYLKILLADSPEEAPNYEQPEYKAANLMTAHVVGNGTVQGNPTVDLIFEDEHGQKYMTMITGGLIQSLAGAVTGMKERTLQQTGGPSGGN